MSAIYRVTRRDFLRQTGVGAGALVFGCSLSPSLFAAEKGPGIIHKLIHGFPVEGVPFVALKLNGDVVIITPETLEKNVNAAIARIEALATVFSSVTKLRIEALN